MPKATCSIEDCERPVLNRGWCNRHYLRWRRHGRPTGGGQLRRPAGATERCLADGCERPRRCLAWCAMHYARYSRHGTVAKPSTAERFWSRVQKTETCWLWTGTITPAGYGRVKINGTNVPAHRYAYELTRGPVPNGMTLDHCCHNEDVACQGGPQCLHRRCVTPSHLEVASSRDNTLRGNTPAAANVAKTHCPKGHAYDEANTWISRRGDRHCRACHRNKKRSRHNSSNTSSAPNSGGLAS